MSEPTIDTLRAHDIHPSPQRVAVGRYVLYTDEHPSAEVVFDRVRSALPTISLATVYNTLNLFVEKGLLRSLALREGRTVFDPCLEPHHHFIDDETGTIVDVPWDALEVKNVESLSGLQVDAYQVVLRGKRLD